MKLILAISSVLLFSSLNGSAQDNFSKSLWQARALNLDGFNNDWEKPFNLYDGNTGLMFAISNDSLNLYLCFSANDERNIRRMMRAGWEIDLSSKEKSKKFNSSIALPGIPLEGIGNTAAGSSIHGMRKDFKTIIGVYKLHFINIKTLGFKTKNGLLPAVDSTGINVCVGTDSIDGVIFEISIPLKELIVESLLNLDELITLGVTVNVPESPGAGAEDRRGERRSRSGGNENSIDGSNSSLGDRGFNGSMPGSINGNGRMGMGQQPGTGFPEENENGDNGSTSKGSQFEKASFKQKIKLSGK